MTTHNKIIFLDIDEVLNNLGQLGDREHVAKAANLDQTAVGILRFICTSTGAKIVISSSWRLQNSDPAWYEGMFNVYGFHEAEVIGITPNKNGHRGTEIAEWIGNHHVGLDSYVIVDDSSDMFPDQPFVQIDSVTGLTLYNAVDIIEILGVFPRHEPRYNSIKQHIDFKREKYNEKKFK